MRRDKKVLRGAIQFVLLERLGHAIAGVAVPDPLLDY
jgi:3-dehydroquinate synthetase